MKTYEVFALCHSSNTALNSYVSEELKKAMGLSVNKWFRERVLEKDEFAEGSGCPDFLISEDQDGRFIEGQEEVEAKKLQRWILRTERVDSLRKPSLELTIGNHERMAILNLIVKADKEGFYITKWGALMDIFLQGSPVNNKKCIKIIMRLLCLVPEEWEERRILIKNIEEYASLLAGILFINIY